MPTQTKHYRLTRRGEIVKQAAVLTVTTLCLIGTGFVGFGLMVGWWTV